MANGNEVRDLVTDARVIGREVVLPEITAALMPMQLEAARDMSKGAEVMADAAVWFLRAAAGYALVGDAFMANSAADLANRAWVASGAPTPGGMRNPGAAALEIADAATIKACAGGVCGVCANGLHGLAGCDCVNARVDGEFQGCGCGEVCQLCVDDNAR